jgi:hypothetical protein
MLRRGTSAFCIFPLSNSFISHPRARSRSSDLRRHAGIESVEETDRGCVLLFNRVGNTGENRPRPSDQLLDRGALVENVNRPALVILVSRVQRHSEVMINRGGQIAGRYRPLRDLAAVAR